MPSAFVPNSLQIWPDATMSPPGPPETKFQVIGCGLPRTGTTSFGEAISILLKAPVFDGGRTARTGTPERQKLLTSLVWDSEPKARKAIDDQEFMLYRLAQLTKGYVGTTDAPGCYMVEELLRLYPDAKVICTVRERGAWWKSYQELCSRISRLYSICFASGTVFRYCMYCLGIWRHIPHVLDIPGLTASDLPNHHKLYDAHAEYIKRVVPPKQLYFYSVKDGWGPLCEILGVPVPDVPFPRANTKNWMDDRGADARMRLKVRIAVMFGSMASVITLLVRFRSLVGRRASLALISSARTLERSLISRVV